MTRLQRFLAIPMAATAVGCLWLIYRQAGQQGLLVALAAAALLALVLAVVGWRQRKGTSDALIGLASVAAVFAAAVLLLPAQSAATARAPLGADSWSNDRVAAHLRDSRPVFVYFTADWCLTCKVNEAAAIERAEVRRAFRDNDVKVLAGDWTDGDPAITRFLESRGRAGVPLYLWYQPGKEAEELPQILTPGMLITCARRPR